MPHTTTKVIPAVLSPSGRARDGSSQEESRERLSVCYRLKVLDLRSNSLFASLCNPQPILGCTKVMVSTTQHRKLAATAGGYGDYNYGGPPGPPPEPKPSDRM